MKVWQWFKRWVRSPGFLRVAVDACVFYATYAFVASLSGSWAVALLAAVCVAAYGFWTMFTGYSVTMRFTRHELGKVQVLMDKLGPAIAQDKLKLETLRRRVVELEGLLGSKVVH